MYPLTQRMDIMFWELKVQVLHLRSGSLTIESIFFPDKNYMTHVSNSHILPALLSVGFFLLNVIVVHCSPILF